MCAGCHNRFTNITPLRCIGDSTVKMSSAVIGQMGKEFKIIPVEVNAAVIMLEAIAYQQQGNAVHAIVAGNLLKSCLGNFYVGRFEFGQQYFFAPCVIDDQVAPARHCVEPEAAFDVDQCAWIFFFADQVVDPVLPDPLFGCEYEVFFS